MQEKVLQNKQNGMMVMLIAILGLVLSCVLTVIGGIGMETNGGFVALFIIGMIWLCVGWIPLMGLRVLKPQETLVLTLFGKYIGTIKGEGFISYRIDAQRQYTEFE
jgi:uncharacterized membrane protein